jgi:hypothetical protein
MVSRLEPHAPAPLSSPHGSVPEDRIEDFLDHLTGPLVGLVPFRERQALRLEVRAHLECLIEEIQAAGRTPDEALECALREFGDPWQTGEAILRERQETAGQRRVARAPGITALHGFAWFGPPGVLCLLLLEREVLAPAPPSLLLPIGAAALLGPVFGGCMTALTLPAKAGRAAVEGAGLLAGISLLAGLLLLPRTEVLLLGLFELVVWVPLGWLSAVSTVTTRRQSRRNRFLRDARQ